jgi:hypothetical protein
MPSKVEVTGSPSVEFAANINFDDFFNDMFENALNSGGGGTEVITCTNPSLEFKTFVLRMEIFREENYRCKVNEDSFDPSGEGTITINDVDIPVKQIGADKKFLVLENNETIAESDEPYTRTFKGLDDYMEGFEFFGIESKIYIYGTELANVVSIDLKRVDSYGTETLMVQADEIQKGPSGVESLEEYTGLTIPDGGETIDISDAINGSGDLSIKHRIYIPKDTEINSEWFDDPHTIIAEIIIWLPMTFDSIEDNAVFKFPDFFDTITNLFKSLAGTGCIENMDIKITIDPLNPFGLGNGIFIINDYSYGNIRSPVDEHSFLIKFNEEEIDYINKYPFDPNYFVLYPEKKSLLEIPNGMLISTISLNAGLDYNAEF